MNNLKVLTLFVYALLSMIKMNAQLSCLNCASRDTTSYTNGSANDSLYFICAGQTASLRVEWPEDELLNVQWYRYISVTNVWTPIVLQQQVSQGPYSASTGGFRVVVSDSAGVVRFEDVCWVSRVNSPPLVNANTLAPGCTSVQLTGLYLNGLITGYYNPPPTGFYNPFIFSESSVIEICLNIEHPILSDLNLEIVTPPACGSQVITLSEVQTPESADSICFNTDAVGLCFSNTTVENYNLCALPDFNVGGTYGAYGAGAVPIDWAPLLGCDVTAPGWQLNIRDCYEGANGELNSFTMTIQDNGDSDNLIIQEYLLATGQNLAILDTGCDSSLYTSLALERVYPQATLINPAPSIQWEAFPPFDLPNGGTALTILLNPGPTVDTYFTLNLVNVNVGDACGTTSYDVEFYDYIPPDTTIISLADTILCLNDSPVDISSSIEDGSWIGPIDSTSNGVFLNPSAIGLGNWTVSFVPASSCIVPAEVTVLIDEAPQIEYIGSQIFCNSETSVELNATPQGGNWLGLGITDSLSGTFNPQAVAESMSSVTYRVDGNCPAELDIELAIETFTPLNISSTDTVLCFSSNSVEMLANLPAISWSGPGMNVGSNVFEPSIAGVGEHMITALYQQACMVEDSLVLVVQDPSIEFVMNPPVCIDGVVQDLEVIADSGFWSGAGIIDSLQGLFDPAVAGVGGATIFYTLSNACATVAFMEVSVQDFPNLSIGLPEGICLNQNEFMLIANEPGGTFEGPGVLLQDAQWYFDPQTAGVGTLEIVYYYNDVCSITYLDTIEVYPLPQLQISADTTICPEGEAVLTASGAFQYGWAPATTLDTPQQSTTIATPTETTIYTVAGQSVNGCFSEETVTVAVFAAPELTTNGPIEICPGDSELLMVNGVEQAIWNGPDLVAEEGLMVEVAPDSTSVYEVTGTDINGCEGVASVEVIVIQPEAYFTVSDTLGVPPLYVQFLNLSVGDYFIWDLGNGDTLITTDINEPISGYYQGEEIHTITLTAFLNGCPSTYSLSVETYYDSELIIVPNVVTPDGDGKNDSWRIKTQNMKDLHVFIYNRWGQQVGELEGINDQWYPADNASGTYYYYLKAEGLDQEVYNREGHFTVLANE